jgi:hypothetical protein
MLFQSAIVNGEIVAWLNCGTHIWGELHWWRLAIVAKDHESVILSWTGRCGVLHVGGRGCGGCQCALYIGGHLDGLCWVIPIKHIPSGSDIQGQRCLTRLWRVKRTHTAGCHWGAGGREGSLGACLKFQTSPLGNLSLVVSRVTMNDE